LAIVFGFLLFSFIFFYFLLFSPMRRQFSPSASKFAFKRIAPPMAQQP